MFDYRDGIKWSNKMETKLLFLGDLYYDYEYLATDIKCLSEWVAKNKFYTILNLEGCIDCGVGKSIIKRGPNLKSNIKIVEVLKSLNVIGVCLANNHIMDYGKEALESTCSILDSKKILYTGAGKNLNNALLPMDLNPIFENTVVLNFGWDVEETVYATDKVAGCAPRDEKIILEQIINAKKTSKKVIVCIHWGFENNRLPMPYDIDLAHRMVDAGADLIIGHHPHCIQAKEFYKGVRIYYSLGNFYFASKRKNFTTKYKEQITNQGDFGLAVSYDLLSGECEEYLLEYSDDKDKTVISNKKGILEDITNIDYNSKNYLKEVRKRKGNINPILTCNDIKNKKKLQMLFGYYTFKASVKKILGK